MKQLKPCPRCGGNGKLLMNPEFGTYKVICPKCNYSTLPWQMSEWAVAEWVKADKDGANLRHAKIQKGNRVFTLKEEGTDETA